MTFRKGVSGNPAGRRKGSKNHQVLDDKMRREFARTGMMPLELLLSIMRDPKEKLALRLDAAKAAAPFMHRKMPVAIEGGDSDRPVVFDASALTGLTR